jgi:uncharacterized membrane protein
MKSRASIAGHPLHPIFVTIPIGLWSFAPVCDLIYHIGWGDDSWKKAALYCLLGGIAGAVPAIITGLIDFPLASEPAASKVAKFHLTFNLVTTFLIATSAYMRWTEFSLPSHHAQPQSDIASQIYGLVPVFISFAAVLLMGISGWLGGELVSRFGIGVHHGATTRNDSDREINRLVIPD